MKLLRALPLVLILLTGCPDPPQKALNAGGSPASQEDGGGDQDGATPAQADGGGGGGDGPAGGAPAGGGGDWEIVAKSDMELIYPTVGSVATWPDPAGLASIESAPEGKRPPQSRIDMLKQLVSSVLAKDLQPKDPDAALGLDATGRLFMRLGRTKTVGSASMDVAPKGSPFPLFGAALDNQGEGPRSVETLRARVAAAVAPDLAKEMQGKDFRIEAHPKINGGARVTGMAELDRQGFGTQFPYLYAFGSADRLLIVLQELPHMSAPGGK